MPAMLREFAPMTVEFVICSECRRTLTRSRVRIGDADELRTVVHQTAIEPKGGRLIICPGSWEPAEGSAPIGKS